MVNANRLPSGHRTGMGREVLHNRVDAPEVFDRQIVLIDLDIESRLKPDDQFHDGCRIEQSGLWNHVVVLKRWRLATEPRREVDDLRTNVIARCDGVDGVCGHAGSSGVASSRSAASAS